MRVPDSDLSLQLEDEATAERSAVTSENILGKNYFRQSRPLEVRGCHVDVASSLMP